jgi:aspartyl-tRNA(Asn)/glutamyl-tRNA(Gln) amidotransferase subunit A
MTDDLNWLSARGLARGYRARRFSPVDAAKACFAQISAKDSKINAMCFLDEAGALASAKASAARWRKAAPRSALDGVPVLVKDLAVVKGWPTGRGSRTVDRSVAGTEDNPAVARLREAGCVLLGMSTTPEFGWKGVTDSPLTGITRNPWDLAKTPGGSSGGSAAGLAAGYAPLATGTDGGGSIRIPAGFSGVFGHKPSFGRVPMYPPSPFASVAHTGPMARYVHDAALMLNVMARPDARDWFALAPEATDYTKVLGKGVKGLKLAYSPALGFDTAVQPAVANHVRQAVAALRKAGAKVVEVDPGIKDPGQVFRTIWWLGVRALLSPMPPEKLALVEPALRDVFEQSKSITVDEALEANRQRALLGSHMRQFMEGYDALLSPTLPITAFEVGALRPGGGDAGNKWVNWTPFTYPFNLTGQPAASVPVGFDEAGLPIGLQVIGRMYDDETVLRIAAAAERELALPEKRPAGF